MRLSSAVMKIFGTRLRYMCSAVLRFQTLFGTREGWSQTGTNHYQCWQLFTVFGGQAVGLVVLSSMSPEKQKLPWPPHKLLCAFGSSMIFDECSVMAA